MCEIKLSEVCPVLDESADQIVYPSKSGTKTFSCLPHNSHLGDSVISVTELEGGSISISCNGCDKLPEGFTQKIK